MDLPWSAREFFDTRLFWADIAQASALPPGDDPLARYVRERGLRFIIETVGRSSAQAVMGIVREIWGAPPDGLAGFRVEPLFGPAGDNAVPDGLDAFFLASLEGVAFGSLARNPYDAAYALMSDPGIRSTEPDLPYFGFGAGSSGPSASVTSPLVMNDKAWALRNMRVDRAWTLVPVSPGLSDGQGVAIAHLDTGWTDHVDLDKGNLDLGRAQDFITAGGNASDPMNYGFPMNPGHGTRTGSVMMSAGGVMPVPPPGTTGPGQITGVARHTTYVPVRCIRSVVVIFASDVARGVWHATGSNCDVVSMSLGGRPARALHQAIQHALTNELVVVAAAGNNVRTVVWPARYPETIAVAASNVFDEPWSNSSRGPRVDIAAPGEDVWVAEPTAAPTGVQLGSGTSYATAHTAAVAALWLAFHGKGALQKAALGPGYRLQELFGRQLRASARVPARWDHTRYGAGIVDVMALLASGPGASGTGMPPGASKDGLVRLLDGIGSRLDHKFQGWRGISVIFEHEICNLYLDIMDATAAALDAIEAGDWTQIWKVLDQPGKRVSRTLWSAVLP